MIERFYFTGRRSSLAFTAGCALVTIGVLLHLPMFWMGRGMNFMLVGMPMEPEMYWGMAAIVLGTGMAGYGLMPKAEALSHRHEVPEVLAPPEDAPLTREHWRVMAVLAIALVIDIMKPASLGLVTPGMRLEYQLDSAMVTWFPFSALTGTVLGSFVWGALADIYGRRAAILLSSVMFVGTAICGTMPDFRWNVAMCFLMGASAGGMLPVAYALLAEIMPTKHRGWSLVLVGGLGAVGGYFAASYFSALLQPLYGWRVMWLLNLPTGLIIVALSGLLPESARFLQHMGRHEEARAALARFGAIVVKPSPAREPEDIGHAYMPPTALAQAGLTVALTLAALSWGLVNFGVLLWLPSALVREGFSVEGASELIAMSSVIALPVVILCALLYSQWSTKWALGAMLATLAVGLVLVVARGTVPILANPLVSTSLLVLGSTGAISILLPYAAECYPLRVRGRASGWVAGCSKLGGLLAQGASLLVGVPPLGLAASLIALPTIAALALVGVFGAETRGRDLRALEGGATASK